jgi:hypothetical protein
MWLSHLKAEHQMKFYRPTDVPEDEQGLLCRQSRLAGVVRLIIWCGVLAIAPVSGWHFGKPWVFRIGLAVAAIVIPMAALELTAMFRATNWLLRIGLSGAWINLRSYRDREIDPDTTSVVYLDYAEIVSVGRHTELYTTPSKMATGPGSYGAVGGSTAWRDEFLEIQLNHGLTDELKTVLNKLRHRATPSQTPTGPVPGRVSPVWLVNASLLRIGWVSNHGPAVLPRLAAALDHLDGNVRVAEPTLRERPNWRNLTADEVGELARELVRVHGATLEVTALLVRAGGMSDGEAGAQVQQFEEARIS